MSNPTGKQIKSRKRVKDFAEVFTAEREVKAMCDLVNDCCMDIDATFLEPSCGTGNFLVEIINRKLLQCKSNSDILRAYRSVYGIDIQYDNVRETRTRLWKIARMHTLNWHTLTEVAKILCENIICGDALKIFAEKEEVKKCRHKQKRRLTALN